MGRLGKIERFCIVGIAAMAAVIAAMLVWKMQPAPSAPPGEVPEENDTLAQPEDRYPKYLTLGATPPVLSFEDADGRETSLEAYRGRTLIVTFWGSWCGYCKDQLSLWQGFQEVLSGRAEYLLIDKLDPEKETVEQAQEYLKEAQIPFPTWFDRELKAYQGWGLSIIPTTVALNPEGQVIYCKAGEISSKGEFQAVVDYAVDGGDSASLHFLLESMTGPNGGVFTNYLEKAGEAPVGHDVLSESQGLLLEYAVLVQDKSLFDSAYQFISQNMMQDGLVSWYVTGEGVQAGSNALLDDLRIYGALESADQLWGGYGEDAAKLRDAIYSGNTRDGKLVGFYDFQTNQKAGSVPLNYLDPKTLQEMAEKDARFEEVYQNALSVLQGGYLGDQFPLYSASYDYGEEAYSQDSLNTAEALYTLYHLARAGLLPEQSLNWLREKLDSGGLSARYSVSGETVSGFDYHSTAVYALAGLIALEEGDNGLLTKAVSYMERYRVNDAENKFNGAFGDGETGDFPSFDQLMPLLLYGSLKNGDY